MDSVRSGFSFVFADDILGHAYEPPRPLTAIEADIKSLEGISCPY